MKVPLPPPVLEGVSGALRELGLEGRVDGAMPVGGGCINHGARLDTPDGGAFFLKWNAGAPPGMFEAEAAGLRALREGGGLRVPEPIAWGGGRDAPSWLLMEHVPAGRPAADHDERLGRGLAALHRSADPHAGFGWPHANWIGSLAQPNRSDASWSAFWREQRILPQLRLAEDGHALSRRDRGILERLLERIPEALDDVDQGPPHLLHGDLWGGNAYADASGAPVLIDPAVYHGHGEVDLAMTELFGGFGARVYRAYDEVIPITVAYDAYRRDLYQLYYLLVHVNLFGGQYLPGAVSAAARVVSALSG
jgi:protein-ribulosamine 3-kinase